MNDQMGRIALLFIVVTATEGLILLEILDRLGFLATLAIVVGTGILGAALAKQQGLAVLAAIQEELAKGQLPAGSLVDGALILIAGAFLMTPGVLTDGVGFLLLIPATRKGVKRAAQRAFERAIASGRIQATGFHVHTRGGPELHPDDTIDVEFESRSDK